MASHHPFNGPYQGEHLSRVAFPLGGIGAGMICVEGSGAFSHVSLRHRPEIYNEPMLFSALAIRGEHPDARILEGPVPTWKIFGPTGTGGGAWGKTYGLPRFAEATFTARFPFATVALSDERLPVQAELTAWSPFTPGDADHSSLPVAMLEYRFTNRSEQPQELVYSFHAANFMKKGEAAHGVRGVDNGFVLWQQGTEAAPWDAGTFRAEIVGKAKVDSRWFRGSWFDSLTMVWNAIAEGATPEHPAVDDGELPSPGGSLYVPFRLAPGEARTIRVRLCWHVPVSNVQHDSGVEVVAADECECNTSCKTELSTYRAWYVGQFAGIDDVAAYWATNADALRERSALFTDTFYNSTLPSEVLEAIAANLTILKSPTVLRQEDGRLWCFEGCCDSDGCCHGSCTHVWNYAQAIPHLFPDLERSLRWTEFHECQDERGHQNFRADLPIRPSNKHTFHAAADGQLGGIMKVYREWRISGDTDWLRSFWPQVRQSLLYCINTWDPDHEGWVIEPHHNTYDIEFWGPDGMCTSFYLGALMAGTRMAEALGDNPEPFATLAARCRDRLEQDLYNGEYFIQQIRWTGLHTPDPLEEARHRSPYTPDQQELLLKEGPRYQYGNGCLSDGVLGSWLALMCGLGQIADGEKITSHLRAVHRYNLRHDLSLHANPQRPGYALGREGGLLLCTWPHGDALSLPFVYSNEVWTGFEYQVAAHLIQMGCVNEGLEIVRIARSRYDGRVRNPFNEYECGHWYGRALSSYGMLAALSGARYDALERTLYLQPRVSGDFQAFISTATGFGLVGVRDGQPFLDVRAGVIPVDRIEYHP
jgi:uncharacterized protein (DUF608 family)